MKFLYQPVYKYVTSGVSGLFTYHSSIVYDTEERARLCALDNWNIIMLEDEKLIDITIKELTIG